jgi:hypothetical protein
VHRRALLPRRESGNNAATKSQQFTRQARLSPKTVCTRTPPPTNVGNTMQTKKTYQVQHWPNGQWSPMDNWCKIEAATAKEAAEKVCGLALTDQGTLARLRARVLAFGDLKQRSATPFYAAE